MESTQLLKIIIRLAILKLVSVLPREALSAASSAKSIPCENDWIHFGQHCYKLYGTDTTEAVNWHKASSACSSLGAKLASIHSKEVQDFLTAFVVLNAKSYAWIGLHDRNREGTYVWEDGSTFDYTYWSPNEPTGHRKGEEDCIEMRFKPHKGMSGEWNDEACSSERPYICQKEGNISMQSPDPTHCSQEDGGGWKFQNTCYNYVNEYKTWEDAEQHCQDRFGGHLVTIPDFTVSWFLDYIMRNFKKEIWIGIKMQDQVQQKWTSGWLVAYNHIEKSSGHFVADAGILRVRENLWITLPCSQMHPFICEKSNVKPPVHKQSAKGLKCPEQFTDWRDFGGEYCYFFDTESSVSWYQANSECIKKGGALASIHSQIESDILNPFVIDTQDRLFIGFTSLLSNGDTFMWSDGSQVDYINWEVGEPNRKDEMCGELWTVHMKWNDVPCTAKKGYICKTGKIPPNSTTIEGIEEKEPCICDSSFYATLLGVLSSVFLLILAAVLIYFLRPRFTESRKIRSISSLSIFKPDTSVEN